MARQEKLMAEQEALEAQVVAFADKTEKELNHKVMSKQLKAGGLWDAHGSTCLNST